MDTTFKYIKMCEKAQEIQNLKTDFENGDIFYLIFDIIRDTFNVKKYRDYADSKIGDVTESGAKCISFNEETQMLEFEYFCKRKEDQIFLFSDNRNEFLDGNSLCYEYPSDGISDSLDLKKIWLPRQDQLQEMIEWTKQELEDEDVSLKQHDAYLSHFCSWINTSGGGKIFNSYKYKQLFDSMEQLWLAFIMKEKYNKIWNEEKQDWIKS